MAVHTAPGLTRTLLLVAGLALAACGEDTAGGDDQSAADTGRRNPGRSDTGTAQDAGASDAEAEADPGEAETGGGDDVEVGESGDAEDETPETDDDASGEDDSGPLISGTIVGTVWAPGNAPGMVPAGQEIPISNAVVYVQHDRPERVPDAVYCQDCELIPDSSTMSDARGRFELASIVPGDYWLIIQKGQFRIEQEVTVFADQTIELATVQTTLPSEHIPEAGMWVPRIALAVGSYDHIEDVLGKMGMGVVDSYGEVDPATFGDHIDLWDNGGGTSGVTYEGTLTQLVSSLELMLNYHIIFIPCGGSSHVAALDSQANLQNIRDYVALGGKLYVTDWSGEWMDAVFPAQITLEGFGVDTPPAAWDPETRTWNPALRGSANGSSYDTSNAAAVDTNLHDWLEGQVGPTAFDFGGTGVYDADYFGIQGSWNTITSVTSVTLGLDDVGEPIVDVPHVYVIGGDGTSEPRYPMTVTFEPVGCGRVLYSTYHTTDNSHAGLTPQERILLYLIMEIGVCKSGKQYVDP